MSRVTNALLHFSILEDEEQRMAEVNVVLEALTGVPDRPDLSQVFEDICNPETHSYGGYKVFEAPLWMAAFNHVATGDILGAIESASWQYPERVQLIVMEEEADGFSILRLRSVANPS